MTEQTGRPQPLTGESGPDELERTTAEDLAPSAGPADGAFAALEEERKRFEDLWLRSRAELENFRKRVAREEQERERRAAERVLSGVLEIQDHLDNALASERDAAAKAAETEPRFAAFYRGVELIQREIAAFLQREGVTAIDTTGVPFDPRQHEATLRVDGKGCESDTVVDVIQKGYLLGDRLLRPARVTVAR